MIFLFEVGSRLFFFFRGGTCRREDGSTGFSGLAGSGWAFGNRVVATPNDFGKWGKRGEGGADMIATLEGNTEN